MRCENNRHSLHYREKDNIYVCIYCRKKYDEVSARHNGLIGSGLILKKTIKGINNE